MKPIDFHDPVVQRAFSLTSTLLVDFPGIEAPAIGTGLATQAINALLSPYLAGWALLDLVRAWRPLNSDDGLKVDPDGGDWILTDDETTWINILIQDRPYEVRLDHVPILFTMLLPLLPERKKEGDVHNYRHTGRANERRYEKAWHEELKKRRMFVMKARKYALSCVGMSGATYALDPSPMTAIHLVNAPDETAFVESMKSDTLVKFVVE